MSPTSAVDRREILKSISVFRDLTERDFEELVSITTTRRLAAKEVLFHKGDPGVQLYGVMRGRLKVSAAGADGKEVVFGLMGPGEVIGEIALLDSRPRSGTVAAMEEAELLSLHRRDLISFLERRPRVAIQLAEVLAGRLRRLSELMEDTLFRTLPSRLAKRLLSLAEAYGRRTPSGLVIDLKLPQHELGEMVGTSRESINKQLRAWVDEGLVRLEKGQIVLRDEDALQSLARFLTM
jgi:CRP/FNR family cyclic AMP-dependent transcriptional regulator